LHNGKLTMYDVNHDLTDVSKAF